MGERDLLPHPLLPPSLFEQSIGRGHECLYVLYIASFFTSLIPSFLYPSPFLLSSSLPSSLTSSSPSSLLHSPSLVLSFLPLSFSIFPLSIALHFSFAALLPSLFNPYFFLPSSFFLKNPIKIKITKADINGDIIV